jgi:tRNA(fMet)-specific endonuclease VapC
MYLLDTDTLTWAHGGHPNIEARLRQVGEENVATTVVTTIEVLRGRHEFLLKASDGEQLLRAQGLLASSEELLREATILPVDAAAAAVFDQLRQNRKLKKVGRADLLIACIALAHRATLVTRNLKHFQHVPGLNVENWMDQ